MTPPENHFYSQYGEDKILSDIFHGQKTGTCVEIGAHDGLTGSATLYFENLGWDCVLVEPIPELCKRIRKGRTCKVYNYAASSKPGEASFYVADLDESLSTLALTGDQKKRIRDQGSEIREILVMKKTLDQILREADVQRVDFITIDVEGHELDVLQGFSVEIFQPRIIIVEDNSNQVDRRILTNLRGRGYVLVRRTGVNDWYAKRDDTQLAEPGTVAHLLRERSMARVENLIKSRFANLEHILPEAIKDWLRRALHYISQRLFF